MMCVSNGTQDTIIPLFDDSSVRLELSDENIETFVSVVESAYKNSFKRVYIGFSAVGDYLVERKYLRTMYNSLVDLFPLVHLVLAMTISLARACGNQVDLCSFFDGCNAEYDNVTNNKSSDKRNGDDEDMSDDLSMEQRTILPENLPHNYDIENAFLEQLSECNTKVDFSSKFQGDMVLHLYPNWKQQDEYIHALLIGCDKTSNEGMMLTNIALLEILGMFKRENSSNT